MEAVAVIGCLLSDGNPRSLKLCYAFRKSKNVALTEFIYSCSKVLTEDLFEINI